MAKCKYTESELKSRGIGKMICDQHPEQQEDWKVKRLTYVNEAVIGSFQALRDNLKVLLTDADKYSYWEKAHSMAQIIMDRFLIVRSRGDKKAMVPIEVYVTEVDPDVKDGMELLEADHFTDRKNVSENEKLRWIFENMQVAGVMPKDAPSAGAYALLKEYRKNTEQRRDFYKTLWPKLLTKEDSEKGGKLQDSGKETIELIDRLLSALEVK